MFNAAQVVLDKSERLLINNRLKRKYLEWFYERRIIKWLSKFIGGPLSFLLLGVDEAFKPMINMGGILFIILLAGTPVILFLNNSADIGHILFYGACTIAFSVTIFALPSTYSYCGVKESEINLVTDYIDKEVVETVDDVTLLEKNFELIFQRVYSRIKFYKLATASVWGLYMYYFNLGIMIWVKNGMIDTEFKIGDHLFSLIGAIIITLFAWFLVTAYKRANERLIKTIQFACIQMKYDLAE